MNMTLFQYAVLQHPSAEQAKRGEKSTLVIPPSDFFLASNYDEAHMKAVKATPDEYMVDADRLEVAVRPF